MVHSPKAGDYQLDRYQTEHRALTLQKSKGHRFDFQQQDRRAQGWPMEAYAAEPPPRLL